MITPVSRFQSSCNKWSSRLDVLVLQSRRDEMFIEPVHPTNLKLRSSGISLATKEHFAPSELKMSFRFLL
jgi:hypothetical protein